MLGHYLYTEGLDCNRGAQADTAARVSLRGRIVIGLIGR